MKFKVVGRKPANVSVDGKQYAVDSNKIVTIPGTLTEDTMRHLIDCGWRPADDGAVKFVHDVPGCKEILEREILLERQKREAELAALEDTEAFGGKAALESRIAELESQLAGSARAAGKGK